MKKIVSLVMALCAMAFVSCSSSSEKTPSGTVKNYLNCLKAEQYEKSVDYFVRPGMTGEMMEDDEDVPEVSEEEWKALIVKMGESMKEQGGLKSYELVKDGETISEDGNSATVETVLIFGNGTNSENSFKLVKVDGEWKIGEGK
jgi:translation initiation factor 2B subunit (eIF-2B alpha/beta/delta family)